MKAVRILLALIGSMFAASSHAWERLDPFVKPTSPYEAPKFTVEVAQVQIPLGGVFDARLRVSNTSTRKITTLLGVLDDSTTPSGISLTMHGPDRGAYLLTQGLLHRIVGLHHGVLVPGEGLCRVLSLGYLVKQPGAYSFNAVYNWRPSGTPSDGAFTVAGEELKLTFVMPEGQDRGAYDYFEGNVELLLAIQDVSLTEYYLLQERRRLDVPENYGRSMVEVQPTWRQHLFRMEDSRKALLARFPTSFYAAGTLLALARQYQRDGSYGPAAETYDRYLERYPESWQGAQVLFEAAESHLGAGHVDRTTKLVESALRKTDLDVVIQLKLRRLETALEKGERSLERIRATTLYPEPALSKEQ